MIAGLLGYELEIGHFNNIEIFVIESNALSQDIVSKGHCNCSDIYICLH